MLIQPLLFPSDSLINEPEFFFRGVSAENISDVSISLPVGANLSLETYFNAFSVGKWKEYTNISNLTLKLAVSGQVEIKAYHAVGSVDNGLLGRGKEKLTDEEYVQKVNTQAYKAVREEADCSITHDDDVYTITFNQLYSEGILYVTIKALSDTALSGGGYETEIEASLLNPVKLAVGICTFKREEAVCGNISRIVKNIIENQTSPLYENLGLYVADNGQTLDIKQLCSDKVHVLPNLNLGGVGGFTRTIIEALVHDKKKNYTHVILMDDDILLYPAVFERTFYLLQLLKDSYKKAILGSSMFLVDHPAIQQESGAIYKDCVSYIGRANHKFFDMRNPAAISANEVVNPTNYTGWWYACIPAAVASENNLPMPYFIHYDDVEYGIRNVHNGQIFINGICVWHPSPDNKGPFWITYYNVRNRLITMFSRDLSRKNFVKYLFAISRLFLFHITRYEYKRASLLLEALNDFREGPEAFIDKDALALHQELVKNKMTFVTPEEAGVERNAIVGRHHKHFLLAGIEQLFCNLLPAKDTVLAVDARYFNIPYRAGKLYIYDNNQDKGYILERDQKAFFKLFLGYQKTIWKLFWGYRRLLNEWQKAKPKLTSLSFWEKYLGLKSEE